MGCIVTKEHKKIQITVTADKKSSNENTFRGSNQESNPQLFIIREESARYEDSAMPSRMHSSNPDNPL